ncbi:60S ribosomal protein L18a-like protein isoform X2 [Brassica rapa]|uniref:60S ribosomal protein L18a-like protein isoform X2 n=1 Tax=Brassica campestris TaxID=3711 RepID=UPI00142E4A69|nr:60S ribosomal protein L18a-like protein isoform X2 [Brassica rapa]
MSKEKDKERVASPTSYGTFQGVPTYPPPLHPRPPQHHPVSGFPQPSQPPRATHHDLSVHQYIQEHQTVPGYDVAEGRHGRRERLPCCGIGIGWFLFITGFLLGSIPWYIGVFILVCAKINPREKPGYIACAIALP